MVRLLIEEDCDNAPKKRYVRDFNIAFAEGDVEKILDMMTEDAVWSLVGGNSYKGRDAIRTAVESMKLSEATELKIDNILSHGDRCAANGTLTFKNSKLGFCDMYVFSSHAKDAKIRQLTSYGIELS